MLAFSIVKKVGEGSYLNDDHFILERVRKERALGLSRMKILATKYKNRAFGKNGKSTAS